MHGWRARLGLIVPSSNTTMEPELWSLVPDGVSIHTARVPLQRVNVEELARMEEKAEEAAEMLSTARVDLVIYGCTTGSLIKGPGHDEEVAARLSKASGRPAIATATAVVKALKELGAVDIGLATPYIDEVNEREVKFLEHHGFRVVDIKALKIEENAEIGRVEPARVYRLVRELDTRKADAVFISCTNLRTIEVIEPLERDLGLPVVSSNTATVWLSLRLVGVREVRLPAGRLLREHL
jgi:maleate isomerase